QDDLRRLVLGLGERSFRKSWYPELQARLDELERFRSLLDCTVEAIVLVHVASLRVVDTNRTARELIFGCQDASAIAPLSELLPPLVLERIINSAQTDDARPLIERWPTVGEGRELETTVRLSGEGEHLHAILTVRDVTERLALERQALTAQRLESVGRLAGGIAHDFNNLIGAIIGTVDLVRCDLPPESDAARDLEDVILVAQRAALLTRRLMSFSRQGTGLPVLVNIVSLVRDLEQLLIRVVGERAHLVYEVLTSSAWVLADPTALEQVIVNLVSNARDAVEMGGNITLRVASCSDSDPPRYLLEVEDNGVGMDENTKRRAFEPFFTTKPVGKGTGLGLSVVANAVAQCGGTVTVHSELGAGTRFSLYLPKQDSPVVSRPPGGSSPPVLTRHSGLVLLVEDEAMLRVTIERALRQSGFEVTSAEDLDEAHFRARRCQRPPTLLISDVVLPDGTGIDLAKQLREKWPGLPTLFISGYVGDESVHIGELGFENLLPKPFTPTELIERVGAVLKPSTIALNGPKRTARDNG
ncbi:MAG TPA: ATP-binding protein, partial [Polyangiaceae bacterium]|nr:ATP-binding protein [Polyangiaceae bacterium]